MAKSDYYLCDVCDEKCFYDANLNWNSYDPTEDEWVRGYPGLSLDYCGDIAAICRNCAKTNEIRIVSKGDISEGDT